MPENPTIIFAGGGTGGHLYPGISVAQALLRETPGAKPLFLCTQREIDRTILEPTGYEFIEQPIVPPVRTVGGLLKFWKNWRETKDLVKNILRERKPAAVLGLGGYAAGVAVKMAAEKKIPTAILNPDVIPGKANQYLIRHVRAVCCQFEETRSHVSSSQQEKLQITGCPIREEMQDLPTHEEAAKRIGLDPRLKTLVITGASQGATTVNEGVLELMPSLKLTGWQVLHLSGKDHAESVRKGYRETNIPALVVDFTPAMSDVWAVANLCISRAGASSCAELTACGVPSILMPYPFHKDMHQRANAKVLSDHNAAVIVEDAKERKQNVARLRPAVEMLLHDATKRHLMATAARALGRRDASEAVAKVMVRMMHDKG